jgi:hypothetical protein
VSRATIRTARHFPWAAVAILSFYGCSGSTGLTALDLERIGGGLSFSIVETHRYLENGIGGPELALYVETDRWYGCVNYSIDADLKVHGSDIVLTVFGVRVPEGCLTATGPAYSYYPLPALFGELDLSISFEGVVDGFSALISDLAIEVSPKEGRFSQRIENRIWRYPPNSFASVCDAEGSGEEPCTELNTLLMNGIDLSEISFPAVGKIPYPTNRKEAGRDWRVSYFRLNRDEDFPLVKTAFCSFALSKYGFSGYLLSWKNERIRSWANCP